MSIVQKLTEGIINRDMAQEGQALLHKWSQTGLLEGLTTDQSKHNMARLLENQAKELLREANSMQGGSVEGFAAVAFPIVRRVFAGLIANELVSVQPMSLPSGLIFFLDFTFGNELNDKAVVGGRTGNLYNRSIYGTDKVGSEITGGVQNVGAKYKESLSGPRDMVGYAYSSPTGSVAVDWTLVASGNMNFTSQGTPTGLTTTQTSVEENRDYLRFDPDILALTGSATGYSWAAFTVANDDLKLGGSRFDFENLSALTGTLEGVDGVADITKVNIVRRLTQPTDLTLGMAGTTTIILFGASGSLTMPGGKGTALATSVGVETQFPIVDYLKDATALGAVVGGEYWGLEDNKEIPEIDIKVDSIAITAQTKKLKAKWTPELGQDLNAYHNLDAEVELTSILSEQIALEIDREILADLVNGATAATYYWSRSPGLFLNRVTGLEVGASAAAPDFTGTVSEWYETLIETINDVSAQIHVKTLRGGANFVVCSPEVANILEFTAGFRANVTADADKGEIGAVKVGSLNRKFDVIVDPYFLRNVVLVGRKGSSFLESGYVYAPYVPLQTTPTIFGPEDFVPRKGVMTRYAKQMVRPDLYGLVIIRGMLGETGG